MIIVKAPDTPFHHDCYGRNLYVPPKNSQVENPAPNVMVSEGVGLSGGDGVMRVGSL